MNKTEEVGPFIFLLPLMVWAEVEKAPEVEGEDFRIGLYAVTTPADFEERRRL